MTQTVKIRAWRETIVREECEFDLKVPDYFDPQSCVTATLARMFIDSEPDNLKWQMVHSTIDKQGVLPGDN